MIKEEDLNGETKERGKDDTISLTAEETNDTIEIGQTSGGGEREQQVIANTPSKIHFETLAYASMWPKVHHERKIE